jgi:hypothetical protein
MSGAQFTLSVVVHIPALSQNRRVKFTPSHTSWHCVPTG